MGFLLSVVLILPTVLSISSRSLADNGQVDAISAATYISELQAVRGFFYWQLLDLYGNVPWVTDFANADATPPTVDRATVYNNLVTDLEESVPFSQNVDGTTYGRMNYYAGMTLLAKLYLNAGVYSGTTQWDKVITACDEVINSGNIHLKQIILPTSMPRTKVQKSLSLPFLMIRSSSRALTSTCRLCIMEASIPITLQLSHGMVSVLSRNSIIPIAIMISEKVMQVPLMDQQQEEVISLPDISIHSAGSKVIDDGADANDPDGKPVNFGNTGSTAGQINELGPQAWRQSGVRIGKWEFEIGATDNMNNDFAIIPLC